MADSRAIGYRLRCRSHARALVLSAAVLVAARIAPSSPAVPEAADAVRPHPSCMVGAVLRQQGDLGEALIALQVCLQENATAAALRSLAPFLCAVRGIATAS